MPFREYKGLGTWGLFEPKNKQFSGALDSLHNMHPISGGTLSPSN